VAIPSLVFVPGSPTLLPKNIIMQSVFDKKKKFQVKKKTHNDLQQQLTLGTVSVYSFTLSTDTMLVSRSLEQKKMETVESFTIK